MNYTKLAVRTASFWLSVISLIGTSLMFSFALPVEAIPTTSHTLILGERDNSVEPEIVQQIATLEVKRALLSAKFQDKTPRIQDIDNQLANLYGSISSDHKKVVERSVSKALKAKVMELREQRRQERKQFQEHAAPIVFIDEEIHSIQVRLAKKL